MDDVLLDDTLKLLNGLDKNSPKRNEIIKYIEENRRLSIFAYGSLLWNPIEYFNEILPNCCLYNYEKGFFCEDFIYRGTEDYKGLTMGLKQDSNGFVNGHLFISKNENIIPFIKSFVKRETPIDFKQTMMDIYTYEFVRIVLPDQINVEYALTCVINPNSLFYLNDKLTLEDQAIRIGQAYGINGTNFQYLDKLTNIYRQFNIKDSFTNHLENLYNKVVLYRQSLSINIRNWFQIYDQLQTLQERKEAVKQQHSVEFISYYHSYISLQQQINQQSNEITSRS